MVQSVTAVCMENRIDQTFARLKSSGQKAFVAYVSGGDPDFDRSLDVLKALADSGADVLEVGLPFSDPLADGIVNQMAAERALNSGCTTAKILELIAEFRKSHDTPIVLFTYLNPIYTYGFERFYTDAAAAGADGILLLDLPPDEAALNAELASASGLHHIRLIAPNTPLERVKVLADQGQGFIYCLSRSGVTGAHGAPSEGIGERVAEIRQFTDLPICVGFGITTPGQAKDISSVSDGIIVGSAIVRQIEANQDSPAKAVGSFTRPLIEACHSV